MPQHMHGGMNVGLQDAMRCTSQRGEEENCASQLLNEKREVQIDTSFLFFNTKRQTATIADIDVDPVDCYSTKATTQKTKMQTRKISAKRSARICFLVYILLLC